MARKQVYGVCLSLLLAVLAGRGNAGINDGLVGHWPLTDNGGTVAVDQSGAGNNGTIQGSPTWAADPVRQGTVLVFDGVDDRVDFGPLFTFRDASWSISLWVKTPPNDNRVPLLGKTVANGGFSAGERDIEITGTGTWGSIIVLNRGESEGVTEDQFGVFAVVSSWNTMVYKRFSMRSGGGFP